jgi:DNA primase
MRAAGRAAERGLPLVKPGFSLAFAALPTGDDPDTLVRRAGRAGLDEVIARARPLAEILFELAATGRPVDTPERRAAVEKALVDSSARIQDATVRERYKKYFKDRLWKAFSDYQSPKGSRGGLGTAGNRPSWIDPRKFRAISPDLDTLGDGSTGRAEARERVLLLTAINHPAILSDVAEELSRIVFGSPELDGLKDVLLDIAAHYPDLDSTALKGHLTERGFTGLVNRLTHGETDTFGFVRATATDEEAVLGFHDVLGKHHRIMERRAELAKLSDHVAGHRTPEEWERYVVVLEDLEKDEPSSVEEREFGILGSLGNGP